MMTQPQKYIMKNRRNKKNVCITLKNKIKIKTLPRILNQFCHHVGDFGSLEKLRK